MSNFSPTLEKKVKGIVEKIGNIINGEFDYM